MLVSGRVEFTSHHFGNITNSSWFLLISTEFLDVVNKRAEPGQLETSTHVTFKRGWDILGYHDYRG